MLRHSIFSDRKEWLCSRITRLTGLQGADQLIDFEVQICRLWGFILDFLQLKAEVFNLANIVNIANLEWARGLSLTPLKIQGLV